jgi:hypothetical protein
MFAGSKFKKGTEEMLTKSPAYEAASSRSGVRFRGIQKEEERRLQTGSRI